MEKPDPEKSVKRHNTFSGNSASGGDLEGQSLLPMLVGGLILIFVGMLVVVFVT
jgi:hypothetical protein